LPYDETMRPFRLKACLLLSMLLLITGLLGSELPSAQANSAKLARRPSIGLALSGGSAFGLAHLGVLRWFADHRIPIDYIAGTSMGGLAAGLYASGRSPQEVEEFVSALDWHFALDPKLPYRDLSFRRKQDEREYPTQLEFGITKRGVRLPGGFNAGHGVGLLLSRFTAPWEDLASFDEMPTPFRTVATDLRKGEEVVFDKGPLFDAVRATMSMPAVFSPVEWHGKLLVDGGLVNNIPVDLVRKMGADIVIAVALDVPEDAGGYTSILGVARQSMNVMITLNERRSLGQADLVLMPDLKGFSSSSYLDWKGLSQRGYDAAVRKEAFLTRLAVSPEEYDAYAAKRAKGKRPDEISPAFVEVDAALPAKIKDALQKALSPGQSEPLDQKVLESELNSLVGLGRLESARYGFVRKDELDGLRITTREKNYGPPFVRISGVLDGAPHHGLQMGIGGRISFLDFSGPLSEWRTDFSLGIEDRVFSELYHRIMGTRWFVAPSLIADSLRVPLYHAKSQLYEVAKREAGGAFDIGYAFNSTDELRVGTAQSALRYSRTLDPKVPGPLSGLRSEVYVKGVHEGRDNPVIPTSGWLAEYSAHWVLSSPESPKQYPIFESQLSWAHRLNGRYHLITRAAGGTTVSDSPLGFTFFLGGPTRMAAMNRQEIFGNHYYYAGGYLLGRLNTESLALFGHFYAMAGYEAGNAWSRQGVPLPRHSASLGLAGSTSLGVVYFGAAVGDRGDRQAFFLLGRFF
jgi:NTE family protein